MGKRPVLDRREPCWWHETRMAGYLVPYLGGRRECERCTERDIGTRLTPPDVVGHASVVP